MLARMLASDQRGWGLVQTFLCHHSTSHFLESPPRLGCSDFWHPLICEVGPYLLLHSHKVPLSLDPGERWSRDFQGMLVAEKTLHV